MLIKYSKDFKLFKNKGKEKETGKKEKGETPQN